jgi:hypothetical protein
MQVIQTTTNLKPKKIMKRILLPILIAASLASARAAIFDYTITFGPEAIGATGSGSGTASYDTVSHLLQLQATYSGLSGNVTQTHIHAATASPFTGTSGIAIGNPSLAGFGLGATSGSYSNTLDMTLVGNWNNTFLSNNGGSPATAEPAFISFANQGRAYWNIHSTTFGGGEIRGFLTLVPEPSSLTLAGLAAAGFALRYLRRR